MGKLRFRFLKKIVEEFLGGVVAAVWVLGALAVGAVAVLLLGLLRNASDYARLGLSGVAAVVLAATAAGLFAYQRNRRPNVRTERPPGETTQSEGDAPTHPPGAVVVRKTATRPKPSTRVKESDVRPLSSFDPRDPDDLSKLKRRLAWAIEKLDFAEAERILERVGEVEDQRGWCQVELKTIEDLKMRSR